MRNCLITRNDRTRGRGDVCSCSEEGEPGEDLRRRPLRRLPRRRAMGRPPVHHSAHHLSVFLFFFIVVRGIRRRGGAGRPHRAGEPLHAPPSQCPRHPLLLISLSLSQPHKPGFLIFPFPFPFPFLCFLWSYRREWCHTTAEHHEGEEREQEEKKEEGGRHIRSSKGREHKRRSF